MLTRTLAGSPAGAQHLAEYMVGASSRLALCPQKPDYPRVNHVLLSSLPGADLEVVGPGKAWRLTGEAILWLGHAVPVHLRSFSQAPAGVLVWRFTTECLPSELVKLAREAAVLHPVFVGPRALRSLEAALILGLRSCPVSHALRPIWSAAKLVELLALLWPSQSEVEPADEKRDQGLPLAVVKALDFMLGRLAEPIGLAEIAAAAGQSPAHFSRVFSDAMGRGPTAHLRWLRMERAGALIRTGQCNVTETALSVGYQSLGQFSRVFGEHFGRSPREFLPKQPEGK